MPPVKGRKSAGPSGPSRQSGSPTRRERAQATRARIIAAAHGLFVERGYTGATMADIAAAADVAVQTVYFVFHTKPELLQECYSTAVLGPDPRIPEEQPWFAELLAAGDALGALRHFAHGVTEIASRVGVLDDVVRAAVHEPEATAVRANSERLRREGFRRVVEHLGDRFGLTSELEPEAAVDVTLALASGMLYRSLVLDYGWSEVRFEEWLATTLHRQLIRADG